MGKFNDFFQSIKALIAGPLAFGSTLVGTSEAHVTTIAQQVRGGFFSVPDLDTLVDIPYEILWLDMEVVVSQHELPGPITVPRKKYTLRQMPPTGIRVGDIPSYTLSDYWTEIENGTDGEDGDNGSNGWTPVFALEDDGAARVVVRVIDYFGGTGAAPSLDPVQSYLGTGGFTTKSAAINVKGNPGQDAVTRPQFLEVVTDGLAASLQQSSTQNLMLRQSTNWTNTYTAARIFRVRGVLRVNRIVNNQYAYADLRIRTSAKPESVPADNNTWLPDGTFVLKDSDRELVEVPRLGVDSLGLLYSQAVQKLVVETVIEVPAGQTYSAYLSLRVFGAGGEEIDCNQGLIEIIGL